MLDKPKHIKTWIKCFSLLTRVKKLKGEKASGGENEITDLFLGELEELTHEEIE